MKKLFVLIAVVGILVVVYNSWAIAAPVSPSGAYLVRPEISGDEELRPGRRLCVRLRFVDRATRKETVFQTGASDVMKWAIAWSANETMVLYSSDIGIYAYDIHNGVVTERLATEPEEAVGRRAYEKRYGRKPIARSFVAPGGARSAQPD